MKRSRLMDPMTSWGNSYHDLRKLLCQWSAVLCLVWPRYLWISSKPSWRPWQKGGSNFTRQKNSGKKMGCWGWEAQSPREQKIHSSVTWLVRFCMVLLWLWILWIPGTCSLLVSSDVLFFDVMSYFCVSTVGGEKVIGDETKFTTVWYLQLHDHKRCASIRKVFNHIANTVYSLSYFRSSFTWSQICFASSFALDSRHTDTNTKNTCSVN